MNTQYRTRKVLLPMLFASLFLTGVSQAADNIVVGNLALVSEGSISVRLSDGRVLDVRLPKSGDLAAKAIASNYKFGDKVEITSRNIDPYLDKSTDNYLLVELKKIRSVGPASPEDVAKVLAVLSWKSGTNLLSIPASPARSDLTNDSAELERIRKANLDIARTLPNFAASERASRFVRPKGGSALQLQVGNTSHRLPVSGDYIADVWQVKVQYTNHRVFETSINLSFPGEAASERK